MKKVRSLQNGHGHIPFQGGAFCGCKSVFGRGFPYARPPGMLLFLTAGLNFSFGGEGDKKLSSVLTAYWCGQGRGRTPCWKAECLGMCAILPPHVILTHGFCPINLSWNTLQSCHWGMGEPLIQNSQNETDLEFSICLQKKNSSSGGI